MPQYDTQIKQAILHPEAAIREYAVKHFSDSHSSDESIVPLVIEATEQYGRENAFGILRDADGLPLTVEAVDWLMEELEEARPVSSIEMENVRCAMALLLCDPQSELIPPRGSEILALPGFPGPLKPTLEEVIEMADWDWPTAWQRFLDLGEDVRRRGKMMTGRHWQLHRYVRSLARFREDGGEQVLTALSPDYSGPQRISIRWLRRWIVLLAGQMRLESAIPLLLQWLKSPGDDASDRCGTALGYIGTDAVVEAVWEAWPGATYAERIGLASALRPVQSTRCFDVCRELLRQEPDEDVAGLLGKNLLHQFQPGVIDIVYRMVKNATPDTDPEIRDLKNNLVIVATITERRFPKYQQWYREAKRGNFGYGPLNMVPDFRIVDNFRTDETPKNAPHNLITQEAIAELASDRASREQILDAIVHPNPFTRRMAVEYFVKGYLPEPEVLPRVIQAIEQFGNGPRHSLLIPDGYYLHTEDTLDWMIRQLHEPVNTITVFEPYHLGISRVLATAPPELLKSRQVDLEQLEDLNPEFYERVRRRIEFVKFDPEDLWSELEALCEAEKDIRYLNEANLDLGYDLAEALSRHPEFCTPRCLDILSLEIDDYESNPLTWMEGYMVYLAGLLKLSDAISTLRRWLHEHDDWLTPLAMEGLTRIGTDSVEELLIQDYQTYDWGYRFSVSSILGNLHSDEALVDCLFIPALERDRTIKTEWASSALKQFSPRAIDPARRLILNDEDDPTLLDLREDVLAAADVCGTRIPEYDQWKDDIDHGRSRIRPAHRQTVPQINERDDGLEEEDYQPASATIVKKQPKVGRNDPCPCGSGKKYKKCCLKK